jgi:hypothetical protein
LEARRAALCSAALGLALLALPVHAAERPKLPKMAVVDLRTVGTFDQRRWRRSRATVAAEAGRFPSRSSPART